MDAALLHESSLARTMPTAPRAQWTVTPQQFVDVLPLPHGQDLWPPTIAPRAQREMVEEPQGQGGLDGEIRVAAKSARSAAPRLHAVWALADGLGYGRGGCQPTLLSP